MKGITRRFMRKMRGLTRRIKAPFRSHLFRKFMRGGQAVPSPTAPAVPSPTAPAVQSPTAQAVQSPTAPAGSYTPSPSYTGVVAPYTTGGPAMQQERNSLGRPIDPATSVMSPQGSPVPNNTYNIKVPAGKINFDFSKARANFPTSFGSLVPGGADASTFTINLSSKYTPSNLPQFLVTAYIYSSTAGYIHVQRQFGTQSGTSAAAIIIDKDVKKITFTNITKLNFPYTANDSTGIALFITLQILN